MPEAAVAAFALVFPGIALILKERVSLFREWSPVIVCYVAGLVLGNLGILPDRVAGVLDGISTAAVALSIPLLLFSVDLSKWRSLAGRAGLSFVLAGVSVALVSAAAVFLLNPAGGESWKLTGLLVGLYTGGTPNLAALKTALAVDQNLYLAVHASDIVLSAVYLFFVMTAAKPLLGRFLPAYAAGGPESADIQPPPTRLGDLVRRGTRGPLAAAFGLAVLVVAAGLGLSFLVPKDWETATVILAITTLSLAASLVPKIRNTPKTFELGEYILYVFCVAVGAMGNFSRLFGAAPAVFLFTALTLFGAFLLHVLLSALFRIDVDTTLAVSVSAICSPPFVGVAAVAIGNRRVIAAGITTGVIGYAVGNYLGIALAQAVRILAGG
ncbi:MAG TPA: DUF819 family protein [Spirochaetia bacterium]|nr:DUF819 family protein [Spirochaetales bacterium]HRY78981.1 DUF819 family protein [Spirochaetia bacterium]HRZ88451.1 DUF819 family protein [Spirochaetia bacterium]